MQTYRNVIAYVVKQLIFLLILKGKHGLHALFVRQVTFTIQFC